MTETFNIPTISSDSSLPLSARIFAHSALDGIRGGRQDETRNSDAGVAGLFHWLGKWARRKPELVEKWSSGFL